MLTNQITKMIDHPDEEGVRFKLRKLSFAALEEAAAAKVEALMVTMRAAEGVTFPDPYAGLDAETKAERVARDEKQARSPLVKYDRLTVLRRGVTQWSYTAGAEDADAPCTACSGRHAAGDAIPLDRAHLSELDEGTAAWLFSAIIGHSIRSVDEGEALGSRSEPISE